MPTPSPVHAESPSSPGPAPRPAPRPAPGALRRRLVPAALWSGAVALVLLAMRPTWAMGLQGDDYLLIFIINSEDGGGPFRTGVRELVRWATVSGIHFNPIAYFVDGALKNAQLTTTTDTFGALALHHTVLTTFVVATLPVTVVLIARLASVFGRRTVSATSLAIPVAAGFVASIQVTAPWSMYDPTAVHPAFGALPTLIGLAYLSSAVAALRSGARRRQVVIACVLGVAGFLTYEVLVAFVAALVLIAALGAWRGVLAVRRRLPWLIGVPLLALAASRALIASHPQQDYQGTSLDLGPSTVRAWATSVLTGEPFVLWGVAGRYVPLGNVVPFALAATAVLVLVIGAWVWHSLRSRPEPAAVTTWSTFGWVTLCLAALAALAPAPFVVTQMWGRALSVFGTTYMHSFIPIWCWSGVIGLLVVTVLSRRPTRWTGAAVVVVLALVGGFQVNVNRQVAAYQLDHPPMGVNVTRIIDDPTIPPLAERCETLRRLLPHPDAATLVTVINQEYERRRGVTYCDLDG